ncbi:MAG: CPBP family intramembrane metalloprotease [Phycisphaeraceae bacterium]|nr:CPBP family intramembrane metalloprotease [Phycisphaeraceae bacterium]
MADSVKGMKSSSGRYPAVRMETSDPDTGRWPAARPGLTALAVVLTLLVSVAMAVLAHLDRAASEGDGGPAIGIVDPQAAMMARLLSAGLDNRQIWDGIARGLPEQTEVWLEGPVAMRLARAILMSLDDRPDLAVSAFASAVEASSKLTTPGDAAPLFRVTAAVLRAGAHEENRGPREIGTHPEEGTESAERANAGLPAPVLADWADPSDDDFTVAARHLGPVLDLARVKALHEGALRPALERRGLITLVGIAVFMGWGCVVILGGFAALLTLGILAVLGKVRSGLGAPRQESTVLLEVFAVYLGVTLAALLLGVLAAFLTKSGESDSTALAFAFAAALGGQVISTVAACGWWFVRGGSWRSLRDALGLTWNSGVWRLLGCGAVSYALGTILLLGGFAVARLIAWLIGDSGVGSPSHPATELAAHGGAGGLFLLFFVGAVMAPVVEEIFFRGALYRGLRDRLGVGRAAVVCGAIGATVVSSFLFAAIHPQGLIFAPVLAGIGAGYCITREWTGSVIPGMIGHALNNGLILLLSVVLLR